MSDILSPIPDLLTQFSKLKGIGPKSADRIVHHLLHEDRQVAIDLAAALRVVIERVHPCRECFNLTDQELCTICSNPRRDASILCVVETSRDVNLFERIGSFRGLYHVLGGRLDPLAGMGPDKLNFTPLADRVRRGGVKEVILATSPTLEGDGTALFATTVLQGLPLTITKLARGLPTGSSLELANAQMLADALDGRRLI